MPSWPTQSDYKDALQNPDTAFRDPDLRQSRAERSPMGVPRARSGAFASVYKMTGPKGTVALKLFNFPNEDRAHRYRAVSDHLERALGPKKPPGVIRFQYHAEGVRVGRVWYPTLTMAWVQGVSLGEWVRQAMVKKAPDTVGVKKMAEGWAALVQQLRAARISHGDLQHDNVLVVGGAPVLVDYDGMCVPELDPPDPTHKLEQLEYGKPAYQHPGRAAERLGGHLDHFAAWTIFVALRAVAADPQLYAKYVLKTDNENLLFTAADMQAPAGSKLWPDLIACRDPEVGAWARALRESLDRPFAQIPVFAPGAGARDVPSPRGPDAPRLQPPGPGSPAAPGPASSAGATAGATDWERIAAEGAAALAAGRPLAPAAARAFEDARKRVACRDAVKRALVAGDPRAAAAAYQPALLDDWAPPGLLAGARAAAGQVALLNQLKAAVAFAGDGRALVRLWDEAAPKLAVATEARAYAAAANGWRARIRAAEALVRAYAKVPRPVAELAEAWHAVLAAGPPHPALTEAHCAAGTSAARWRAVLVPLHQVPNVPAHETDARLLDIWGDGSALDGCAEAAPFVARVAAARTRLDLVRALERAIREAEQGGPEEPVAAAAAALPPDYPHPHAARAAEAVEALGLVADLRRTVAAAPPSDRAIATAYDRLKARNLRLAARLDRLDPELFREAEGAVQRRKLLDRFARIDADEPRRDKQDQRWLRLWAEHGKLLVDRADREELRARLTLARDRFEKWSKVAAALKAGDPAALRTRVAAYGADLAGYPPLEARAEEIQALLTRGVRVAGIKQKIDAGGALAPEDMAFIRDNHEAFGAEVKAAFEAQVRARLAGDARLVPAYPAYSSTGTRGGLVKACWTWGGYGLISHCVVAVDGRRFLTDPAEADPYSRLTCPAENHRREGGGVTLVPPAGATHAYVTVWPVAELGWKTIYGPPLTIGPVPVGAAGVPGGRW